MGLTGNSPRQNEAKIAKCLQDTAQRDIQALIEDEGGRAEHELLVGGLSAGWEEFCSIYGIASRKFGLKAIDIVGGALRMGSGPEMARLSFFRT